MPGRLKTPAAGACATCSRAKATKASDGAVALIVGSAAAISVATRGGGACGRRPHGSVWQYGRSRACARPHMELGTYFHTLCSIIHHESRSFWSTEDRLAIRKGTEELDTVLGDALRCEQSPLQREGRHGAVLILNGCRQHPQVRV